MVQTRRQSGKLSIPQYNEDDLSDGERVGGANAHKRRRISEFGKRRKIRRPNPKDGKLSILPSVPLDILFEIFTHLTPKDLLTLSRTSHILRSTLLSKNATTVWKRSLTNMPGPPPACPKDMSEARWAELLYGATNCHICGTINIFNIDFGLRRRLCLSCKKTNLVYSGKFSKKFPEFDPTILDLIPYATISGWRTFQRSYPPNHKLHNKPPSKYFLESDIYSMAQTFGLLTKNVHMRKPGAKAKLEEFKKERAEFVKDVVEYAKVCEGWAVEEYKRLSGLKDEVVTNRRNEITSRLRSLGYDQIDFNAISWSRFVHQYKDLTDRSWNIILPKLESEIQARREARARVERSQLIYSRRRLAGPAYRNWKVKNIPPKDWPLLPQDFQVVSWEGFDSVIEAASDVVVGEESFEGVLGGLEEVIEKWKVDKKRKLVSLVPVGTPSSSSISEPHAGPQDVDTSSLELATSIFICTRPYYSSVRYGGIPPVMGTAQLLSHTYPCFPFPISDGDSTTQVAPSFEFRFSEDLSSVAKSLVESVGGDVERIMMKDMDKRDARFFCVGCARVERSGPGEGDAQHQQRDEERRLEVGALSWRACINHFMTIHRTQEEHQDPSDFRLLPPILEEQAIAQECCEPDPSFGQSAWLCACCDCHVYRGTTRDGAITHVQTQHGVENPLEDEHFVFDSRITKLFRPPQIVRLDEEVMLGL